MPRHILADTCVSISELKKNPSVAVAQGKGFPVAVLNRKEPVFYCVPASAWEEILDRLEDIELNSIAGPRKDQPVIEVDLHDL
ncbi:type II toxin-antitoxin system Phd/YefM family antitoxin [Nitrincola sp.]|uniref:type II toxin-antitoxin system Phd/YefM family antitoxin n=1 Tax=Nitrincola sp. TaxID=1926584 RepID=UPI003A8F3D66